MKKISSRQLMIFYCLYSFSIKFLVLPQLLTGTAGRDAWLSALIGTVVEVAVLFLALTVLARNQEKDIYSELRNKTTKVGATFILLGMLTIFLFQIFILLSQTFHLLNDNMFEKVPVYFYSIPVLLLGVFFCFMPVRAIFRSGEIFFVLIIIGVLLSVFPSIWHINPSEVLPVLNDGVGKVFNGFYLNMIYFESAFLLLMFTGEVKIEKHFRKKFMLLSVLLGAFFVFFVFMFYALFGPLSPEKDLAVSNLTLYSSFITQGGRLDWILVTIWLLLTLLRFGITFYCAFSCLRYITRLKRKAGYISLTLAVFIYIMITFVFSSRSVLDEFLGSVWWLVLPLCLAIPIIIFVCSLIKKRAELNAAHEKVPKQDLGVVKDIDIGQDNRAEQVKPVTQKKRGSHV